MACLGHPLGTHKEGNGGNNTPSHKPLNPVKCGWKASSGCRPPARGNDDNNKQAMIPQGGIKSTNQVRQCPGGWCLTGPHTNRLLYAAGTKGASSPSCRFSPTKATCRPACGKLPSQRPGINHSRCCGCGSRRTKVAQELMLIKAQTNPTTIAIYPCPEG